MYAVYLVTPSVPPTRCWDVAAFVWFAACYAILYLACWSKCLCLFTYACVRVCQPRPLPQTHTHTGMPVYCGCERVISAVVSVCWSAFVWLISITKPARLTCYHNWRTKLKILCRRQNKAETENCDHNTSLQRLCLWLRLLPKRVERLLLSPTHLAQSAQWQLIRAWPDRHSSRHWQFNANILQAYRINWN